MAVDVQARTADRLLHQNYCGLGPSTSATKRGGRGLTAGFTESRCQCRVLTIRQFGGDLIHEHNLQ